MAVLQFGLKPCLVDRVMEWMRESPFGLSGVALVVGAGAGPGAGFRWIIYAVTWLATGREQFGQKGRVASLQAVGGVLRGLVLLVLPQMYGAGYPVMNQSIAGNEVLWFLLILITAKMITASLTIGIGGSGGVFARRCSPERWRAWPSASSPTTCSARRPGRLRRDQPSAGSTRSSR